uniref:Cilia- and flagella-associated protein 298 n=1 Tax=Strigamia maritima TaxID=126957 RepID=T1JJX7_STRMM
MMVLLHVKNGITSQFLYETTVTAQIFNILKDVVAIYNGRLKIERICAEIENLAEHGTFLPHNMQGLTDEQIEELRLVDEWSERCVPSGGHVENKDPIGRRNGKAPNDKMKEMLKKATSEAKAAISKKIIDSGMTLKQAIIGNQISILRGAVTIVYPMGLPIHDPIRMEFENREDLEGTQASLEVLDEGVTEMWLAGKQLAYDKTLEFYVGKNEKSRLIVKLQRRGKGAPQREPVFSEQDRKDMMMHAFRKQEELKKLNEDNDDNYLDSDWADNFALKKSFHGVKNVSWHP